MLTLQRYMLLCLLLPLGLFSQGAAAQNPAVHEFKLDNGLKLIVKEDHRSPVVVSQVWYKVGSTYEHDGVTGLSHALEHMMFKGTPEHGPNEFSRIIAENGGRENAFTSHDYTAYFQELEKARLKVSFELESDRMRHLTLDPKEFAKEIQVVMEERRMRTDDDPESLTDEQFNAVAFLNSAYRIPVIGWMDDLKHMRVEDLRKWYETWYAPNNATLVVVGDVDPQQVYNLAKKYFGPLKPSTIPEVKPRDEIPQTGVRRITVKAPAELPYLVMGYKVPVLRTAKNAWEPYALEVLAGILDGGDSARIAKNLIRGSQVAAQASAGYSLDARSENLLALDGTPAQGHTIAELETALREQVKKLREDLVSEEELKRIKAQVVTSDVYQKDSVFYQAMQIGSLESVGLGWQVSDQYVDKVKAVTAEQVRDVARKYLIDDHLTVAVLDPQPISDEERMRRTQHSGGDNVR
jgi:zinc protease